jgi:hypothetical protein
MKIPSKINNHLSPISWLGVFYNCRDTFTDVMSALQIAPFLTNKPNFLDDQNDISPVITMNYEQRTMNYEIKNKANSNPIQSQYKANSKPIRTQFKPKQTQFCFNHVKLRNLQRQYFNLKIPSAAVVQVSLPAAIIFCLIWRFGLDHRLKIAYFTRFIFSGHIRLSYLFEGIR